MKAKSALIAAVAFAGIANSAMAATQVINVNQTWPAVPGTTAPIIVNFAMPAVASVQSITLQLAHTWASDLDIYIDTPAVGTFDFDLIYLDGGSADLGVAPGNSSLANVGNYVMQPGGAPAFVGPHALPGTYAPNFWTAGPIAAGNWALNIRDGVGGDGGAVGQVTIQYTEIPAPGALALLGLAGLVGRRRRA